jgi:multicomponent Na+:H+ antiporter subunit A
MLIAVLSGFLFAVAAPWMRQHTGRYSGWVIGLLPAGLTGYFASHIPLIAAGETLRVVHPWVPGLDIQLSFYMDGLSLLFALLISGIGTFIFIYAGNYMNKRPDLGRFYVYLLIFMASMLGLVLADNLIALFVFWELTSISSYLLIGIDHKSDTARKSALQALLVTAGGGLALLAGFILLGMAGGSFEISELLSRGDAIREHGLYLGMLILVLIGCFTKSAQVPFHFWLPSAMAAPTPVSAYLHSATMVKAGVFLLARLFPVLSGTLVWSVVVPLFGAVTMLTGIILAMRHTDLKLILAYTTVAALGTLTLLLGIGTELAVKAAIIFLVVHSLYKGALFLVAGSLDHGTGSRDITVLGGHAKALPITFVAAALAGLSMAGIPPLLGFLGKEMIYEAAAHADWLLYAVVLTLAVVVSGMLHVVVAGIVGLRPFVGQGQDTPVTPHEAPFAMWIGPLTLASLGLLFGLLPGMAGTALLVPAMGAVYGVPIEYQLKLWHGFNWILVLSLLTLLAGVLVYRSRAWLRAKLAEADPWINRGPEYGYFRALDFLNWGAQWQTRFFQNGYLGNYLRILIGSTVVLVGSTLLLKADLSLAWHSEGGMRFYEIVVALLMLAAAIMAVRRPSRLSAVAALGITGYSVAMIYVLFSAPDLALTQILVETLTVLLFVLIFYRLPGFQTLSPPSARRRDALFAVSMGGLVTVLMLAAMEARVAMPISEYHIQSSQPLAFGRNIVNVILVDFRALDTLGEIVVLVLAAVGVYALMKLYPSESERQQ